MMRRTTFTDSILQEKFDRDGFVVLELMGQEKVTSLLAKLKELESEKASMRSVVDSEYKLSFFSESSDYRKRLFAAMAQFFQPMIDEILHDYEPLIVNAFDKEPGTGEVPVHQNWTFVNEEKYTSVSVWVPLTNVSHHNGTLEVVPGTHRSLTRYRSPSIPWVFEGLQDVLKRSYMQPLNLKLGQVAILDDALLHYSSRNKSEKVRSSIQLIMKPKEAPAVHYHCGDGNLDKLDVYEVDQDFFTTFKMGSTPQGVAMIGSINHSYRRISEEELNLVTRDTRAV